MVSFNLGEAQGPSAPRAFAVDMCFPVPKPIFLQNEPSANFPEKTQKCAVFQLSRGQILRKTSERGPNQQQHLHAEHNQASGKEVCDCQNQDDPYRHAVKGIAPIPSHPKAV